MFELPMTTLSQINLSCFNPHPALPLVLLSCSAYCLLSVFYLLPMRSIRPETGLGKQGGQVEQATGQA